MTNNSMASMHAQIAALTAGEHAKPFALLGMHTEQGALMVRALLPGAHSVAVIDDKTGRQLAQLERVDGSEVFECAIARRKNPFLYRLRVDWGGQVQELYDAYRFAPVLGELD